GDDALAAGVVLGELDGGLHGLGPAVGEGELLDGWRCDRAKLLRGVDERLVAPYGAGVDELVHLLSGGRHDGGVAVAEVGGPDAAREVGPASSVGVGHPDPLRADRVDGGVERDYGCDDVVVTLDQVGHASNSIDSHRGGHTGYLAPHDHGPID